MNDGLVYESLYVRRAGRPNVRSRLFCFPCAGAGASMYGLWPQLLTADVEVIAIQLPGREDRVAEAPLTDLGQMARLVAQAIRPYLTVSYGFFGHSGGALLGFEVSREVRRRFGSSPVHLFVASQPAPHLAPRSAPIHAVAADEFIRRLRELDGTTEEILANEDVMQLVMPALRADFASCEQYRYVPDVPLSCAVTAFGGVADRQVTSDALLAWEHHTSGAFSLHLFEGGHFFLNGALPDVAAIVADALRGSQVAAADCRSAARTSA